MAKIIYLADYRKPQNLSQVSAMQFANQIQDPIWSNLFKNKLIEFFLKLWNKLKLI